MCHPLHPLLCGQTSLSHCAKLSENVTRWHCWVIIVYSNKTRLSLFTRCKTAVRNNTKLRGAISDPFAPLGLLLCTVCRKKQNEPRNVISWPLVLLADSLGTTLTTIIVSFEVMSDLLCSLRHFVWKAHPLALIFYREGGQRALREGRRRWFTLTNMNGSTKGSRSRHTERVWQTPDKITLRHIICKQKFIFQRVFRNILPELPHSILASSLEQLIEQRSQMSSLTISPN